MIFNLELQDKESQSGESPQKSEMDLRTNFPTMEREIRENNQQDCLKVCSQNTSSKQRIENDRHLDSMKEIFIFDIIDGNFQSKEQSISVNESSDLQTLNNKQVRLKLKIADIYDDKHVNAQNLKQISKVNSRQINTEMDHKEEPQLKCQKNSNNISLCNTKQLIPIPHKENQKPGSLIVAGELTPENIIGIVDCFLYRAVKIYRVKLVNNEVICVTANNLKEIYPKLLQSAILPNKK